MRFVFLFTAYLFCFQSCNMPSSKISHNSQSIFILNAENLDQTVWGIFDEINKCTYLVGFYLHNKKLLGVYCETSIESKQEAIEYMEKNAQENPQYFVFQTKIEEKYIDVLGPGVTIRLSPLNEKEADFTIFDGQTTLAYSMTRYR